MPDWSFPNMRRNDSKDERLPPETKTKPARATMWLQDVQGSTTTLEKSRDNTTRSFTSSTMPKNWAFRLAKQIFTLPPSQPSLMNVGRTAFPSSPIDDVTLGSSAPPNGLGDQRRPSSTSRVLVSKDVISEKWLGDGREVAATSQTTTNIQPTFTESGDQLNTATSHEAPSLTTKANPSTTGALTTELTVDSGTAANIIPSRETPTSDDNEKVLEEHSAEFGHVPLSAALVTNSDDPQTDLPSMEVAIGPELLINPEWLNGLSSSSPGSSIKAPMPTESTALTTELLTNPPTIVWDITSDALDFNEESVSVFDRGFLLEPDSTPSLDASSRSARVEITETPVADPTPDPYATSDPYAHDPPAAWVSQCLMIVAPSPFAEETRRSRTLMITGTNDDAPRIKPMHDDVQIPNILFFGETGVGKSSVIDMLMGRDAGVTSKTSNFALFFTSIDERPVRLWDTAGLNDVEEGTVPAKVAMQNLRHLVGALREGIALLVYCIRATRFRPNLKENYDLVHGTICQGKVPVFIVITGLENEVPMNAWWAQNEAEFSRKGMSFDGHACVTSTRGKRKESSGRHMYDQEFQESQRVLRKLIKDYFATPRLSWAVEDYTAWELETSSKIDNYYDGKNQGVETNVEGEGEPENEGRNTSCYVM